MAKAKTKAAAAPAEMPEPVVVPKVPRRIRMLTSLGRPERAFPRGSVHIIGVHICEETAEMWLAEGHAEEDKSLPGPSETK